ncbi:mitochondrial assembly of ribosomal large subunit protein 1 [Kryptolebias marmoratus]|uniref:Mitochondrial assembly of ribosomal large subunit protein 1 n=1 Tax=Kryptolebias marmoratus TaxID=37003 RepID=A0A3Q3G5V1_KRYMA|nr:mitochondrial assembly of ribosomal large subunit protein 1 [Kryptolebias marmoratus]XP_037836295.1 mitochondrial assembly of ribosomal large subunit protein 1 [Kryptolebias marmoratus]XP_037836296.1 mitochondrial assembly of ribosomal large subunit protein 1 [Kryptolebias marmoratus]
MNALFRCRVLASVCRQPGLLGPTGGFGRVCSLRKTRNCSFLASRHQQQRRHAASRRLETRRCSSDGRLSDSPGTSEEGPGEGDEKSPLNHRPSEAFTLDVLVSLLRQENAADLCVIKVPDHVRYTEHFIVVSGLSPRHLRAMALYAVKVYKFLKKEEDTHVKIEGKDAEDWLCVDFGDIVVHFMLPETRELYELEKLWVLRSYDEQLQKIPTETLPEDFILDVELPK